MRLYLDSCVLIYALDGAEPLRRHTLQQLERYGDADWVISDLVRMECLVGPLRSADQIRLLWNGLILSNPPRSPPAPAAAPAVLRPHPARRPARSAPSPPAPRGRPLAARSPQPAALETATSPVGSHWRGRRPACAAGLRCRVSRVKSLGRLASNKLAGEGRRWLCGCRVRQRGTGDRKAGPTRL